MAHLPSQHVSHLGASAAGHAAPHPLPSRARRLPTLPPKPAQRRSGLTPRARAGIWDRLQQPIRGRSTPPLRTHGCSDRDHDQDGQRPRLLLRDATSLWRRQAQAFCRSARGACRGSRREVTVPPTTTTTAGNNTNYAGWWSGGEDPDQWVACHGPDDTYCGGVIAMRCASCATHRCRRRSCLSYAHPGLPRRLARRLFPPQHCFRVRAARAARVAGRPRCPLASGPQASGHGVK